MPNKGFSYVEHTADIGIKFWGNTYEELFKNAMVAMLDYIAEKNHNATSKRKIHLIAFGAESLLVSFLNEILFLVNTKLWLPHTVELEIKQDDLWAEFSGGPITSPDTVKVEVKAATYHNLKIEKKDGKFETIVYFDL